MRIRSQAHMRRVLSCFDETIKFDTRVKEEQRIILRLIDKGEKYDYTWDNDNDGRMFAWPIEEAP